MSNVFRRFHKPTGIDYWDNAVEADGELFRILTNEKIVPKSRRFIYTIPILSLMGKEWNYIGLAFDTYPAGNDAEEKLKRKKDAFRNARDINEAIIRQLQAMVRRHPEIDIDKLDHLGDLLTKESSLLDKARENSRVQKGQTKAQRPPARVAR